MPPMEQGKHLLSTINVEVPAVSLHSCIYIYKSDTRPPSPFPLHPFNNFFLPFVDLLKFHAWKNQLKHTCSLQMVV